MNHNLSIKDVTHADRPIICDKAGRWKLKDTCLRKCGWENYQLGLKAFSSINERQRKTSAAYSTSAARSAPTSILDYKEFFNLVWTKEQYLKSMLPFAYITKD